MIPIITILGATLLICAFYPELRYYYRRSKIVRSADNLNAETARKLTNLSIRYSPEKQCVFCGHIFQMKNVISYVSYCILFLICTTLIISCPLAMPELLNFALGSYLWVYSTCVVLRYCLKHFRIPFILSLTIAFFLPICIYTTLYYCLPDYQFIKNLYF